MTRISLPALASVSLLALGLVALPAGLDLQQGDVEFQAAYAKGGNGHGGGGGNGGNGGNGQGRGAEQALLEFHRRYIDIQFVVAGIDLIGWLPTPSCQRVSTPYDEAKDVGFFYDRPATWLSVAAGQFALFFPEDAHAPLAGQGAVHKAVVKVAV